ncbi:MAG: zinc-binding dehydrogenase [Anaeromyxobacter sp.]
MTDKFTQYRATPVPVPARTLTWNMYGAGLENVGRAGRPETFPVPSPGPDQLLVRVDAVGMCFSDVKLIKQGGKHPKLYDRDLSHEPTRLGHEVALTVVEAGEKLRGRFRPGQRLGLQPDIYQGGRSTAYGYTIPGGLTQFHLLGPEVLDAEGACFVLPLEGDLGYAATALTEPWACVEGAYRQRRRLEPRPGGVMWLVGRPGDATAYTCSRGLEAPATFVLTDAPPAVAALVEKEAARRGAKVIRRDGVAPAGFAALSTELTGGAGFDDVVLLEPRSAEAVGAAGRVVARRGTLNLVGRTPLDGPVQVDVGRIHYDYTAYVGSPGPDLAASYGEARNRAELRDGGLAVYVGAGGPMGQMHVQRALELPGGPRTLLASDVNGERLAVVGKAFASLARERGKELVLFHQAPGAEPLREVVDRLSGGRGADDVIVSVPVGEVMADAARLMAPDGMLVLFAGVPNGTYAPLDLSAVYLHNAQYTGTSGSTLDDQRLVIRKALDHTLSPQRSVGAVGGLHAAVEGARAMMEGRFPGKILIFPQLPDLPLLSLPELAQRYPEVGGKLDASGGWTPEAEKALIERFWAP